MRVPSLRPTFDYPAAVAALGSQDASPNEATAHGSWTGIKLAALFVVLPLSLLAGVIYWLTGQQAESRLRNDVSLVLRSHVDQLSTRIEADFLSTRSDVLLLADTLADIGPNAWAHQSAQWLRRRPRYSQIRVIGSDGWERTRVEQRPNGPLIRGPDELQLKRDRYYVHEGLQLPQGAVYVSPLDLNKERGALEFPENPTIRFVTVFVGPAQERLLLVINDQARFTLQHLSAPDGWTDALVTLTDDEGFVLSGPKDLEWAKARGAGSDASLAARRPRAWSAIQAQGEGLYAGRDGGLLAFGRVHPMGDTGYRWRLLVDVPGSAITARLRASTRTRRQLLGLAVVLILGAGLLFTQARQRQDRLREAATKATRLAAVGQALAALAHESRNALQRSQAAAALLHKHVGSERGLALLSQLEEAQTDLNDLHEALRHWASPPRLEKERAALSDLLHVAWEQLATHPSWPAAQLNEVSSVKSTAAHVDRRVMARVFRNLLENALDNGAVPAQIDVRWLPDTLGSRAAIRLELTDNGPGFQPGQEERMFEAFVTTRAHGTGLGLAISRGAVEAHGGTLRAHNRTDGPSGAVLSLVLETSP